MISTRIRVVCFDRLFMTCLVDKIVLQLQALLVDTLKLISYHIILDDGCSCLWQAGEWRKILLWETPFTDYAHISTMSNMGTPWHGNTFPIAGAFSGEFTDDLWMSLTKDSNSEFWCLFWCKSEQVVEQILELPKIWNALTLMSRRPNDLINPLRAKYFRRNIKIYLHFMSLLYIDMTQVLKIHPQVS